MDGNMEMDNIIELMDENDNPVHFEHLMTLEHEGAEYVLLVPVDPIEDVGEDEVIILRIDKDDDGEDVYVGIEDEDLLKVIFEKYLELAEADEVDFDGDEQ